MRGARCLNSFAGRLDMRKFGLTRYEKTRVECISIHGRGTEHEYSQLLQSFSFIRKNFAIVLLNLLLNKDGQADIIIENPLGEFNNEKSPTFSKSLSDHASDEVVLGSYFRRRFLTKLCRFWHSNMLIAGANCSVKGGDGGGGDSSNKNYSVSLKMRVLFLSRLDKPNKAVNKRKLSPTYKSAVEKICMVTTHR